MIQWWVLCATMKGGPDVTQREAIHYHDMQASIHSNSARWKTSQAGSGQKEANVKMVHGSYFCNAYFIEHHTHTQQHPSSLLLFSSAPPTRQQNFWLHQRNFLTLTAGVQNTSELWCAGRTDFSGHSNFTDGHRREKFWTSKRTWKMFAAACRARVHCMFIKSLGERERLCLAGGWHFILSGGSRRGRSDGGSSA